MMGHGYHTTFGTPADTIVDDRSCNAIDARIPVFFFTHLTKEPRWLRRRLEPAALRDKTVIGLIRDPRDAAVSRFHHERHRSRGRRQAAAGSDASLFDYLCNAPFGLPFYIDSLNLLQPFAERHPRFHLFTYEAFRRDAGSELARLMSAAGTPLSGEAIAAAVARTSFETMRRREAQGFYQTSMLRPGDPAEPNSFKVRRGKVGGYRDELDLLEAAALDRLVDERLLSGFGYRSDEHRPVASIGSCAGVG